MKKTPLRLSLLIIIYAGITCSVDITSSPKLGVGVVCDYQNVTLTCHSEQLAANIMWLWRNHSQRGQSITIPATLSEVMYTCVVSDGGQHIENASVIVAANGTPPLVTRDNFYYYISQSEGTNLTLIAAISTDLPFSRGFPQWAVNNVLVPSTLIDNHTTYGVLYSRLSLRNLSYYDDSGNYTCTACNKCGCSFVYDYVEVRKAAVACKDSGAVVGQVQNVVTVVGEFITFSSLFKGNLAVLGTSLTSYWKLSFPLAEKDHEDVYVFDNSTNSYRLAVYQNCLTGNGSCCNFISQMIILKVPQQLDGITLTSTERLEIAGSEPSIHSSVGNLTVLVIPELISGPEFEGQDTLQCQFRASTLDGVTVVVWEKNNAQLPISQYSTNVSHREENLIVSALRFNSSGLGGGMYTCYCYYNSKFVTSKKPVISNRKSFTFHGGSNRRVPWVVIGVVIGIVATALIVVMLTIAWRIYRHNSNGSDDVDVKSPEEEGQPSEEAKLLSPVEASSTSDQYGAIATRKSVPVYEVGGNVGDPLYLAENHVDENDISPIIANHHSLNISIGSSSSGNPIPASDNDE